MADDFDFEDTLPEDDQNRTFVIAAAALGALILLSLVLLAIYAFVVQPRQQEAALRRPTEIALTNTAVAFNLTQTAEAVAAEGTAAAALPTAFPTSTSTPTAVVEVPTEVPPTATDDPAQLTATAEAAAAAATPTPTALPSTGFGEDVGLPGLAALAAALLGIIFLSRRLQTLRG